MTDFVQVLTADLIDKLETVPKIKARLFDVFDEMDLLEQKKSGLKYPIVGVAYENTRRITDSGSKTGLMVNYAFRVILMNEKVPYGNYDARKQSTELLVEMQNVLKDSVIQSTQRRWRFIEQAPLAQFDGFIFYKQIWEAVASLN